MGCCPVAVVIMHVHKYETRIWEIYVGRANEKHAVATWSLGSRLSIFFQTQETKKNLCRGGRSQDLPNTDF